MRLGFDEDDDTEQNWLLNMVRKPFHRVYNVCVC